VSEAAGRPTTAPLPPPPQYRTTDELRDFVAAFEATTLPYARWTHAGHLSVAFWYLVWYGREGATDRVRAGIQRFNAAHPNEPMAVGYHETITRFWLWRVHRYLRRANLRGSLAELANQLITECSSRELPFTYYSRERLMSPEARRGWVEPDLRELEAD
jgi:hypothetical protein